jgi:hypothetical protein
MRDELYCLGKTWQAWTKGAYHSACQFENQFWAVFLNRFKNCLIQKRVPQYTFLLPACCHYISIISRPPPISHIIHHLRLMIALHRRWSTNATHLSWSHWRLHCFFFLFQIFTAMFFFPSSLHTKQAKNCLGQSLTFPSTSLEVDRWHFQAIVLVLRFNRSIAYISKHFSWGRSLAFPSNCSCFEV